PGDDRADRARVIESWSLGPAGAALPALLEGLADRIAISLAGLPPRGWRLGRSGRLTFSALRMRVAAAGIRPRPSHRPAAPRRRPRWAAATGPRTATLGSATWPGRPRKIRSKRAQPAGSTLPPVPEMIGCPWERPSGSLPVLARRGGFSTRPGPHRGRG